MPDLLARLDALLRQGRPAYYARLRPGVDDEAQAAAEAELGVTLPAAFKAFYRWRDGQEHTCYTPWLENQTLLPLGAALRANRTLTELLQAGEFGLQGWWHPHWLPFLADGGGNHLCLDMAGAFTGRPGQIIEFWHDDPERPVVAPDFASWLDSYARLLVETLSEQGDAEAELELFWEHLPGYPLRFAAGGAG